MKFQVGLQLKGWLGSMSINIKSFVMVGLHAYHIDHLQTLRNMSKNLQAGPCNCQSGMHACTN